MKHYKILSLIVILFSLVSCQEDIFQETFVEQVVSQAQIKTYTVEGDDIPLIIEYVNDNYKQDRVDNEDTTIPLLISTNTLSNPKISTDNVEVTDNGKGARNYAFLIKSDSPDVLTNLIVRERSDGYLYSFIREFHFANNSDFTAFEGEIITYRKDGVLIEKQIFSNGTITIETGNLSGCGDNNCNDNDEGPGGGGSSPSDNDDNSPSGSGPSGPPPGGWPGGGGGGNHEPYDGCATTRSSFNGKNCITVRCIDSEGGQTSSDTYCAHDPSKDNLRADINSFLVCSDNCPPTDCFAEDCDADEDPINVDEYYECRHQGNPEWVCCDINDTCTEEDQLRRDCYILGDCEAFEDFWEEEHIITDDLPECLIDIIDALKSNQTNDIAGVLRFFDDNLLEIDIEYRLVDSISNCNNGIYNIFESSNSHAVIDLSEEKLKKATDIYIANLILHETLHAYMSTLILNLDEDIIFTDYQTREEFLNSLLINDKFKYFYQLVQGGSSNPLNRDDYPGEYQHDFMTQNFLRPMFEAVQEYHNDTSVSQRYYWELAWSGLNSTDCWTFYENNPEENDFAQGEHFPVAMTENNMNRILQTIFIEQDGLSNAKGKKLNEIENCL